MDISAKTSKTAETAKTDPRPSGRKEPPPRRRAEAKPPRRQERTQADSENGESVVGMGDHVPDFMRR